MRLTGNLSISVLAFECTKSSKLRVFNFKFASSPVNKRLAV